MPSKRSKSEERNRKIKYRQNRDPAKILLDQEKDRIRKNERKFGQTGEERELEKEAVENENKKSKYNEAEENQERIRRIRKKQTEKEKERENNKAKERMKALRDRQTTDEKEVARKNAMERMKVFRGKQTDKERELQRLEAQERMEKQRLDKSVEDSDYEKIIKRQRMREVRIMASGKEHLLGNLKAKKGMQLVNQEGTLRDFSRRERLMTKFERNDDLLEWKNYWSRSDDHRRNLEKNKPDLVERINDQIRLDKERERQEKSERKKREKDLNEHIDSYDWISETEYEKDEYDHILTKEEREQEEEDERRESEAIKAWFKQEQKEKRQRRRDELKKAITKPIDPFPERELCQYEKIREDIIREREEAMAKFKFYEDLEETKKAIGLSKGHEVKKGKKDMSEKHDENESL